MAYRISIALISLALPALAQAQEVVVLGERPVGLRVSELSADTIASVGAPSAAALLNRLPGVNTHLNNGVENLPAIRSPVLTGGQSAGSFLILEDGVPIRAPGFGNVNALWETSLDFADAIALVRGPGGAAYGPNAVHGVVDVSTLSGTPYVGPCNRGSAALSADSLGGGEAVLIHRAGKRFTGTSPCGRPKSYDDDTLTLAYGTQWRSIVGVSGEHQPDWRDAAGVDRQGLILGFGNGSWINSWELEGRLVGQNLNQETASFIEGPAAYRNRALAETNPTPEAYRDTQLVRAHLTALRRFDTWSVAVTPFARAIEADLNLSFFPSRAQEVTAQRGAGVQLRAAGPVWLLGADLDVSRGTLREVQTRPTIGTFTQGVHYDYAVEMTSVGAFAEADFDLGERLRLIGGLRGDLTTYSYDNRTATGDVGRFRRPADRTDRFDAITPKLGLIADLLGGQGFVNLARGARPPQITDLYSLQTTQTPGGQGGETIDSVELGWSGDVGPVRVELATYRMDKTGTSFRNADGFTVTGAATRHEGLELSADWEVSEVLRLSGWVARARHTYRFDDASARAGEAILAGTDIDSAPRLTGFASASWRFRPASTLQLDVSHTGRYLTNAAGTRDYPGHTLWTARLEQAIGRCALVRAQLTNLTDVAYAERADFAFGQDRYFPGAPRALQVGLTLRRCASIR